MSREDARQEHDHVRVERGDVVAVRAVVRDDADARRYRVHGVVLGVRGGPGEDRDVVVEIVCEGAAESWNHVEVNVVREVGGEAPLDCGDLQRVLDVRVGDGAVTPLHYVRRPLEICARGECGV